MNKKYWLMIVLALVTMLLLSACSGGTETEDGHSESEEMHMEIPAEYENLTNPFADDHEAIDSGAEIYEVNCATCHGPEGKGDGIAAAGLDPKPASLNDAHMMEEMSDGALFWRVREGGVMEPFNSAMPPWKSILSDDEIWQVIAFIREFAEEDHD